MDSNNDSSGIATDSKAAPRSTGSVYWIALPGRVRRHDTLKSILAKGEQPMITTPIPIPDLQCCLCQSPITPQEQARAGSITAAFYSTTSNVPFPEDI